MNKIQEPNELLEGFETTYMNAMQLRANLIDSNVLIAEIARAGGKTEGVMTPRIIRVANDMPKELAFLVHKTYVALLSNVWPNIQANFSKPIAGGRRSMLEYGIDYVVGESKIPPHFLRPHYPVTYPKHSILFRNGFNLQMVASDQPESVAGRSGVHAFVEEMKHQKGEKLKTRLFPSLRGSSAAVRLSPYYQGITGVSDTARVDLGEDDWFEEYEKIVNNDLIQEIATVSLEVNEAMYKYYAAERMAPHEKNPVALELLRLEKEKAQRRINLWMPRLRDMRRNANYYIHASSFVNKDILGPKFFRTQIQTLDMDEFLTSICAIRKKAVVDRFFAYYDPKRHQFSDSYKYAAIMKLDLKDHFILTASYLKHYDQKEEILIGYDPGHFSSIVVAQENLNRNECRIIKEFTCYYPSEQPELARQFFDFFGTPYNKKIVLYHDRAGNKSREEYESITTDARMLRKELVSYGYDVELKNEGQSTIFYWQQFKLLQMVFGGKSNAIPKVTIDENECPNLCSSIMLSPRTEIHGRIQLDKTSEKKVATKHQAGLTTQLPSALIYFLFGRYGDKLPSEMNNVPDNILPSFTT